MLGKRRHVSREEKARTRGSENAKWVTTVLTTKTCRSYQYSSFITSVAVVKHSDRKQLREQMGLFGLHFRAIVHYGGKSVWRLKQELEAKMVEENCLVTNSGSPTHGIRFSSLSCIAQDQLSRNRAAHSALGPSESVNNKGNSPQTFPQTSLIQEVLQLRLSCQMTLGSVNLTVKANQGTR